MSVASIRKELRKYCSKEKSKALRRFFKTGPGEYGEGDVFIGVMVPYQRAVAAKFCSDTAVSELLKLLKSPVHEERLTSLIMLVSKFAKASDSEKRRIYEAYLKNTRYINNWDLVDLTAQHIVGAYLDGRSKRPLYKLARSSDLWERRIAMLSTLHYIRKNRFDEALRIAGMLVSDEEDLIHKAVGWMLREIGKRDMAAEERFLDLHARSMPRTMLRYAVERFPEQKRTETPACKRLQYFYRFKL
jgi:Predicted DNA alkylation repair enzyme